MEEKHPDNREVKSDKDAINLVRDSFKDSEKYYREKFELFNYFDEMYIQGARKRNTPKGRANLMLPIAFQQIEDYVALMMDVLFGEPPFIGYVGRGPEDEAIAESITKYTQKQLDDGNIIKPAANYFRNCGKYGTAIFKIPWELDEIPVTEARVIADPVTGDVAELEEVTYETTFDGPRFYNISIYDFFVPRSATSTDIQKLDWCIHRTYRTLGELLRNENYKNKDQLKHIITKNKGSRAENESKNIELDQHNSEGRDKFVDKIQVLEWWGNFNFKTDSDDQTTRPVPALIVVAMVGNEYVLLRKDKNPLKYQFKPFVASNDYPIEGEFYGYGELHHTRGLIEESTALRNARLDIANFSINHMWLIERNAGVNLRTFYNAPNKVILTNDNNGIRRLEMGGVTPSSVQELSRIDFDIQNTTQIVNPAGDVAGVGPGFGNTARGVSFLQNRSNLRTLLKVKIQEKDFFEPLARILNLYNKEYTLTEQYFRTYDGEENPYELLPDDAFLTTVDFKATSNPQKISKQELRQNFDYLLQVSAQFEGLKPGKINVERLLKEIYKAYGFSHPEKFVNEGEGTVVYMTPDGSGLLDQTGQPVQIQPLPPEALASGLPPQGAA